MNSRPAISHLIAFTMVAGAMLFLAAAGLGAQQPQQQVAPIELNQSLLDKWLVAMPDIVKLGTSSTAPQTDDAARPHIERICANAGFDSYDQCAQVIGYVGMIVSACDKRSRTFRDPVAMMRREIARLQANKSMPAAAKEHAITNISAILAALPDKLPDAHIELMNANRDRIFAVLQ